MTVKNGRMNCVNNSMLAALSMSDFELCLGDYSKLCVRIKLQTPPKRAYSALVVS